MGIFKKKIQITVIEPKKGMNFSYKTKYRHISNQEILDALENNLIILKTEMGLGKVEIAQEFVDKLLISKEIMTEYRKHKE